MIQPARVLPSNASPLRPTDNVFQASRVLQEHSGNRQQTDYSFGGDEYEQKYHICIPNENACSIPHQQQYQQVQAPQLYHPQPQRRQPWSYSHGRGGHRFPAPELEASIRFDAERLYNRFRKSDQYVKYRNRQVKDDKGNGDQKWPDHLEKSFFRALVQWPPMGRRKTLWKDKQRGRNELIADCIEELTGERRTRKQVSSHIQVLKPFVENDPYIMKWLAKDDMGTNAGRYHGAYPSGRRLSNFPVTAPPHAVQSGAREMPRVDIAVLRKVKGNLDVFEPVDFQMFVQQNYKVADHEEVQRLHTYTQSIASPLGPDLHIDDQLTLDRDFPLLAAMHNQRPLDCNVVDAEASLAFPTETWKGKDGSPMPGVELGIYFLCTSQHLSPTPNVLTPRERAYQVKVHNSFYENGVCARDHSGPSEARLESSERGNGVETRIKFGSTFWARTLGRLAGRLLDTSRNHRDEVAAYLRNINAVQEIAVLSEQGIERLLVIHWSFRLSSSAKGRTSWRRLTMPTQASQYTEAVKDRIDSMYGYPPGLDNSFAQQQQEPTQLALQSPFEYESSSGSTLSSATWPGSLGDEAMSGPQISSTNFGVDDSFDFNAGTINFAYDTGLNFDHFDSSAFNFDSATADFAADPALQDYSQQWYDSYPGSFSDQQTVAGTDSFSTHPDLSNQVPTYDDFPVGYDQQSYVSIVDSQAYGGAGQEMLKDDALAALADASFIASSLGSKQEPL